MYFRVAKNNNSNYPFLMHWNQKKIGNFIAHPRVECGLINFITLISQQNFKLPKYMRYTIVAVPKFFHFSAILFKRKFRVQKMKYWIFTQPRFFENFNSQYVFPQRKKS